MTVVRGTASRSLSSLLVTPVPSTLALTISLNRLGSRASPPEARSNALQNQKVSSSTLSAVGLAMDLIIMRSSECMLTILCLNI